MNQITHEDFGVFQTECLSVDFITFNLKKLYDFQIDQLAVYFQSLGFNCQKKVNPDKNFTIIIILKINLNLILF